jgi:hypothetical protein
MINIPWNHPLNRDAGSDQHVDVWRNAPTGAAHERDRPTGVQ